MPHFQLVVGGQWSGNAASYGLAIGAYPSRAVPRVVEHLSEHYTDRREDGESFAAFVRRVGKPAIREHLAALKQVPSHEDDPSYYVDWGDAREHTTGDIGVGECAGEVVSLVEFGLADSERHLHEGQNLLDGGDPTGAAGLAYRAMLQAAKALVREKNIDITDRSADIEAEFRRLFHDTKVFHDPFAGAKFARYLFQHGRNRDAVVDEERARQALGEAQLFIEAAHACHIRLQGE